MSSPPIIGSCHYGIDTPNRERLIAYKHSVEEVREYIGVDSLAYQTLGGLVDATGLPASDFCLACFTGTYPTAQPSDFKTRSDVRRHVDISAQAYDGGRMSSSV
ncbi:MAG TPA: hypothetical protein ENN80_08120 [Candidatus Hydrogenedentes bacterium]|nr:hypothetical protein [Candidatus Hydrogenedentota bacterium]